MLRGENQLCTKEKIEAAAQIMRRSPYLQTGRRKKENGKKIHTLFFPNLCCNSFHKIMPNHLPAVTFIENPSLC